MESRKRSHPMDNYEKYEFDFNGDLSYVWVKKGKYRSVLHYMIKEMFIGLPLVVLVRSKRLTIQLALQILHSYWGDDQLDEDFIFEVFNNS
jgi:hypothetical protein